MDHSVSANFGSHVEALAQEFRKIGSPVVRQHLLQDMLNQLETRAIVVFPHEEVPDDAFPGLYRVFSSCLNAIRDGVSALSVIGQRDSGHRFMGVPSYDIEQAHFREDMVLNPSGMTFNVSHLGPFDLHLPSWVDGAMAAEISGILWRVLRFVLSGYQGGSEEFKQATVEALAKAGREKQVRQYAALGYMRWLLTLGGIRTFDVFGNEVEDTPDLFYGELFQEPNAMPKQFAHRAGMIEEVQAEMDDAPVA